MKNIVNMSLNGNSEENTEMWWMKNDEERQRERKIETNEEPSDMTRGKEWLNQWNERQYVWKLMKVMIWKWYVMKRKAY